MCREGAALCTAGCPGATVPCAAACGLGAASEDEPRAAANGELDAAAGEAGVGPTAPTTAVWGPPTAADELDSWLAVADGTADCRALLVPALCREGAALCTAGCPGATGPCAAACGLGAASEDEPRAAANGELDAAAGEAGVGPTAPTTAVWGPPTAADELDSWLAVADGTADCRAAAARRADCLVTRSLPTAVVE